MMCDGNVMLRTHAYPERITESLGETASGRIGFYSL